MKKVLFTATVDSHILHFHLPYLKMFKEKGYEVHVATNTDDTIPFCDVKHKVSFERNPFKTNNLKAIKQMKKILLDNNFDIVHTHTPMGSVVTRLAYKKVRNKVNTRMIYTAHGFHFYKGAPLLNWLLFYPVEKYLSKYTDTLITINKEDYELAKKKFKKCRNVEYVPGVGIDEDKFNFTMTKSEKLELRKSFGLKENDFVLIYPARLDKNKNQGLLIEVMEELIKKHKNIHLLLPGEDELNGYYQKMSKEKSIEKYVHFLEYRTDIPKLLKISDLAVSTSKREGLPINIIESMYVGLPIVASNCRGNRDLVEDWVNGYLIDLNDKDDFIQKIEQIYNSSNTRKKFKKNNLIKINQYILPKISEDMLKIYFRKKKVLHLLASNKYSGAENVVCTIIDLLKNEYDFAYCSPDGEIASSLAEKEVKFLPLKQMSIREIRRVVKEYKPDIIHAHDYKASCYASLFYKKVKIISHIHGNNTVMNNFNLKSMLYTIFSKRISKVIYVSDSCINCYKFRTMLQKKSVVLPNVINSNEVKKKAEEWKCNNKYDLIFLGRLEYPKNPERLIEIIKEVKTLKRDIKVAIVGTGNEEEKIKQKVKICGLNNNVDFCGFQSNPFPIMKNSSILIMSSIFEGTPMVALEAQCLGLPIVSTPVDGLKEIVENNKNGYLSEDNVELAKNIVNILHKNNIGRYKKNSLLKFSVINDEKTYFNTIETIYKNLIER